MSDKRTGYHVTPHPDGGLLVWRILPNGVVLPGAGYETFTAVDDDETVRWSGDRPRDATDEENLAALAAIVETLDRQEISRIEARQASRAR